MRLFGDHQSGNCYKVGLAASILGLGHDWVQIDILGGDTRKAEFLRRNPNGKIPLLELDDGRWLAESNAILNYLAEGSPLLPAERYQRALVLQWQFFEQYSHEPYIAVARFIAKYLGLPEDRREEFQAKQAGGHRALQVMEGQLAGTPFLTGSDMTIADISLYGYTHVAGEGGFDLTCYPAVGAWLHRIESCDGYVAMSRE